MANLEARYSKAGELYAYRIRIYLGKGADGKEVVKRVMYHISPEDSPTAAKAKAMLYADELEQEARRTKTGGKFDEWTPFRNYCSYVLQLKEAEGLKQSTLAGYYDLSKHINEQFGDVALKKITVQMLNKYYISLGKSGSRSKTTAKAKKPLLPMIEAAAKNKTQFAMRAGMRWSTVKKAADGEPVSIEVAKTIAKELKADVKDLFTTETNSAPLSPKTIREHHRLISTVLRQAVKEGLLASSPADRATLPRLTQHEANYYQADEVKKILHALQREPIQWQAAIMLLLVTGIRRGELCGLKWDDFDEEHALLHIQRAVYYRSGVGTYIDTPKSRKSVRWIRLTPDTVAMLKDYKKWQDEEKQRVRSALQSDEGWIDEDFIFAGERGGCMNPDTVSQWCRRWTERVPGLPTINPHAFRHTLASLLIYGGVDEVSVSRQLGHAQTSTTANIYAHQIAEAQARTADIISQNLPVKIALHK